MKLLISIFLITFSFYGQAYVSKAYIETDETFGYSTKVCLEGSCEFFPGAKHAVYIKETRRVLLTYANSSSRIYDWDKSRFVSTKATK